MKIDYSTLVSRVILRVEFDIVSGLRIGGIDPEGEAILRAYDKSGYLVPLVKDSTIRGILRSEFMKLEQIILNKTVQVQIPKSGTFALNWNDILFGVADLVTGSGKHLSIRGALKISDVLLSHANTEIRTMVSIDRKSRTVGLSGPFTQEIVTPSSSGAFEIQITNLLDLQPLKILFFIIDEIGKGRIAIGGKSTSGMGRISSTTVTLDVYHTPLQLLGVENPLRVTGPSALDLLEEISALRK